MARTGGQRRWAGAAAVAAVVLTWSSASWACTLFFGKMTLTGNAGPGVVTVIGNNNSMTWCPSYPLGKAKATLGGSVTITVKKAGPDSCTPPGSKLPEGVYDVNYTNGVAFERSDKADKNNSDNSRDWIIDCMTDPLDPIPNGVKVGTLAVDSFGKGTGTFALPAIGSTNGPTDESAVCVSDTVGQFGLQAPVTVI